MKSAKKKLSPGQAKELLGVLKIRFEKNMKRHEATLKKIALSLSKGTNEHVSTGST